MAILTSCCCFKSIRRGCFASGIFTLAVYLFIFTACLFQAHAAYDTPVIFFGNLFMMILAAMSVIASVILLIGVFVDRRKLLLPFIVIVSFTTLLHMVLALYFITESPVSTVLGILFVTDLAICVINVYCVLCAISQYQEYLEGRGGGRQHGQFQSVPVVRFDREGSSPCSKLTVPRLAVNGKLSPCFLEVPSPSASCSTPSRSPMSTELSSYVEEQTINDIPRLNINGLGSISIKNSLQVKGEIAPVIKVIVTEQAEPSSDSNMKSRESENGCENELPNSCSRTRTSPVGNLT
ncbi:uncharacterized protein LOC111089139 [Limulus polyphemus]|uniref:Uncharacterized protein LOC111089139 n=1 Tax=Limulus polyphemus TaxID=6850 RepID=A0ABM1TLK4_LIMPO|nr:uncharacterized protein LOC111089139 [Limulus polyphemus]